MRAKITIIKAVNLCWVFCHVNNIEHYTSPANENIRTKKWEIKQWRRHTRARKMTTLGEGGGGGRGVWEDSIPKVVPHCVVKSRNTWVFPGLHGRLPRHAQFSLPVDYMTRVIGREHSWTKSTLSNCPPRSYCWYLTHTWAKHTTICLWKRRRNWGKTLFHHTWKVVKSQKQKLNKHFNAQITVVTLWLRR